MTTTLMPPEMAAKHPEVIREWIEGLPPGPGRDRLAEYYAEALTEEVEDDEFAAELGLLDDVEVREHADHDQSSHGNWASNGKGVAGGEGDLLTAPTGWDAMSKAQRKAALAQAKELGEPGIVFMTNRMNEFLDMAVKELGPKGVQAARDWYPKAKAQAKKVADSTGIPLKAVVAATAVTSPKTEWGANQKIVEVLARRLTQKSPITVTEKQSAKIKKQLGIDIPAGTKFDPGKIARENPDVFVRIAGAPCPGSGWKQSAKAVQVMTGQLQPNDVLRGPKTRSFYNNIMDPSDKRFATIDRHAYRTNTRRPTAEEAEMAVLNRRRANAYTIYAMHVEATRRAAEKHDLTPNAVQAIAWVLQKKLYGVGKQAAATRKRNEKRGKK